MPTDDSIIVEVDRHQETRRNIHDNSTLTVSYLIMNGLAAVIACYGLLENSAAVIIGAMLIALLLGPITGIALALGDGDLKLLRNALVSEGVGVALVVAIAFVIGKVNFDISFGSQIMGRTEPNIMDLMIALAGGAAGAYATISKRLSAGLVGVAIATALVPPLCACGLCLAHGLFVESGGAFLLFFTNLVAIQSAQSVVFWASGFHRLTESNRKMTLRRFAPSALLLSGLTIFLAQSFESVAAKERLRSTTERLLRQQIGKSGDAYLAELRIDDTGRNYKVVAVVRAPWVIQPSSCARLQAEVRRETQREVDLYIWTVFTRQCDAHGFVNVNQTPTVLQ
jgi:uncharacterized hydrophobic protein (TIGR00271 family)